MNAVVLKETSLVPNDALKARAYLKSIGVADSADNAVRVWSHFNRLATEGYNLASAHTTMEMEALVALNLFEEQCVLERYYETVEGTRDPLTRKWKVDTIGVFKGVANDLPFYEAASATGTLAPVFEAHANIVQKCFGMQWESLPQVTSYHTDTFVSNQNTAAPTRVTLGFSNGMSTQYVHENVMHAGFMALNAGFEMDMRKRGIRATGMRLR